MAEAVHVEGPAALVALHDAALAVVLLNSGYARGHEVAVQDLH